MRVLIAGGGTGGHIYPAISIANALREMDPQTVVEFVGTPTGLENKLVPRAGYPLHFVSIGRLSSVSIFEKIKTILLLPWALLQAVLLVLRFRPDAVLGVGGFASGPVVFAASLMSYQTYIWEPNAFPGLANRLLSRWVNQCLVVFAEAAVYMKNKNVLRVHMPVRKEIEDSQLRIAKTSNFRVLVFGGSQGARPINTALSEAIKKGGAWLNQLEIVHQTGPYDFERIRRVYADSTNAKAVQVFEYLHDMPERYAWADLVIARAGTGTISELAACGKAALLIPLPTAADDHQTKNAEALVKINGAQCLLQSELTPDRLISEIVAYKSQPQKIAMLEKNIRAFHKPKAAYEIAKIILNTK